MYIRILRQGAHTRRFTVRPSTSSGWEISDEEDSHILSTHLYSDWHRVERAMIMFALEATRLLASGWVVDLSPAGLNSSGEAHNEGELSF